MADTSQQQQETPEPPQTNGVLDGLTEDEKSKMRPADIDADMREMERRKRVEMMMNSRLFREELERIIETQMKDGAGPSGLLQQISEMMGHQGARFNANVFRNSNCVVPINDIRGVESMGYAKGEKLLRCKLAAVFRLLDLYGWTQGVGGVITARLNQDQEHFLVNPYGLLYHEVTASSLVKVDMQGNVVEQGTTNFGVHIASYQLHSTIHAARPDIKCIVHIATPSVTAISATKCGLLPLGQESIVIGDVSTHHHIGGNNLDPEEREKLARNFGPINKVMLLTNRGALCCGETVEEAFFNVYNTVLACETQLKLMPLGVDNLTLVSDESRKAIYEGSRKAPVPQPSSVVESSAFAEKLEKRWRIGGTEFEALMRMLDNAGFRTGYIYRHPLVKSEPPRPRNDVEVPPAVSSLGYLLEEEELYKQGLWKGGRKGNDRTRWLNSPNVYQKVEILETGTPDPKKITKWVSDGSPTHSSTPVKIDGALQFVPKNTNPKEFKQLQQQIKDYRRADKISAGPQSHILEGVTWEEAKKMQDATISGTGEQVVLVGAASKGIIQRGFQHNAMVYKTPYAKNPFDAVTDQELDQYKKEVERKAKGDIYDESQSESEALSSFNISRATHESSTAKSPIQSPVSVTSETEEESRDEPKVLRIETKQVPAPSQAEVVLSDGVSGVSRLSSRSNSSTDDIWSWNSQYPICYLETAREQELARPAKPLLTEIQTASAIKRKMKQNFFENYETRLKNNAITMVNNETESKAIHISPKFESISAKFNASENKENMKVQNFEISKKPGVRRQLEMETEVNEIQYCKKTGIDFAEKVNLPFECKFTELNICNQQATIKGLNCQTATVISYISDSDYVEMDNIKSQAICSLNNNLKEPVNDNEKYKENNAKIDVQKSNCKMNEEITNYINEIEMFVSNKTVSTAVVKETLEISVNKEVIEDYSCNVNKEDIEKFDSSFDANVFNKHYESKNEIFENTLFLVNENDVFSSTGSSLNSTLKVVSDNEIDITKIDDAKITNVYVNEIQLPICNNTNELDNNNLVTEECGKSCYKSLECVEKIDIDHNNINNNENITYDKYVNEIEFFVCNDGSNDITLESNAEDPLYISSSEKESEKDQNNSNKRSSKNDSNHINLLDTTGNSIREENEVNKVKHINFNHSTPFSIDTLEKNPLDESLKIFLENESSKGYISDQSFDTTIKNGEKCEDVDHRNKNFSENSNLWLSIDSESDNLLYDEVERLNRFSIARPSNLEFTYSEIDGSSSISSPASYTRDTKFFSDEHLVMNRITHRDSITDVLNSLNANIRPTNQLTVDSIADTGNSAKYNLDSQNMSLIYSLTPPNDIGDSSKNTTITEDILGDEEDYKAYVNDEVDEDVLWLNLSTATDKKQDANLNKTAELSEISFFSNMSNQGSDILELPSHTYLDLQKSSDEIFHKNMSTSVNQILTELNDAEVFVAAENFVDELIYDVSCLNLPNDISKYSKLELNNLIQEKIWALNFAKKLAKDLVGNLPNRRANDSTNAKVSNNVDESSTVPLDESFFVIREIIHHVVDKDSSGKRDFKNKITVTDKNVKESMNIELKSLKEDYDVSDEKSLKCSTPKILLSPRRSRNNSISENQIEQNSDNEDENEVIVEENVTRNIESHYISDTGTSTNSSPSTESQNFAEQEITLESTDNDTKSDDSKEKQSDTCKTLKNQSDSSSDQMNSKISLDSPDIPNYQNEESELCVPSESTNNDTKSDSSREKPTDTSEPVNNPLVSSNEQLNSKIFPESPNLSADTQNECEEPIKTDPNKVSFCVIEYTREDDSDFENVSYEISEQKSDGDVDSDESIKDFMHNFADNQEEIEERIEHMWKLNEAKLEEMYATERLDEISDMKQDLMACQEKIDRLIFEARADVTTILSEIEEQATSFICNDEEKLESHVKFERVDECCRCCDSVEPLAIFNTTKSQTLPPISEDPELECLENAELNETVNSFDTLPPIFEEQEMNSSCDESKTTELFYSCQNSVSMKSCDDQITNSTFTVSTEEDSEHEKNNSVDDTINNFCRSDTAVTEKMNFNDETASYISSTGDFVDISSACSSTNDNEVFTLECMTHSYDTKEFIKLEMACSNSNEETSFVRCDVP